MSTSIHQKTCRRMFIALLFTITPNCKIPKCSQEKRINRYTMVCLANGILQSNENEQTMDTHNNTNVQQKKPETKEYIPHGPRQGNRKTEPCPPEDIYIPWLEPYNQTWAKVTRVKGCVRV